jgi:hypothetical protein
MVVNASRTRTGIVEFLAVVGGCIRVDVLLGILAEKWAHRDPRLSPAAAVLIHLF